MPDDEKKKNVKNGILIRTPTEKKMFFINITFSLITWPNKKIKKLCI